MMPLEPAAHVDQESEARCMTFREAVAAEPFDLLGDPVGEFLRVALGRIRCSGEASRTR